MKQNKKVELWGTPMLLAVLLAVVGTLLAIGVFRTSTAQAASYTVSWDAEKGAYTVGDVVVCPVELGGEEDPYGGWTITGATLDGDSYQDEKGTCYLPANIAYPETYELEITLHSSFYIIPTQWDVTYGAYGDEVLTSAVYDGGGTTLTYENPSFEIGLERIPIYLNLPDTYAEGPPDENGVVETYWKFYQRAEDGIIFKEMLNLRLEGVDDLEDVLDVQGVYPGSGRFTYVDLVLYQAALFPGGVVTITLAEGYSFGSGTTISTFYPELEEGEATLSLTDSKTMVVDLANVTENAMEIGLHMDIRPDITVTFTPTDYFSVLVEDAPVTSVAWPEGTDLPFVLEVDASRYAVTDWAAAVPCYMITVTGGEVAGESIEINPSGITNSGGQGAGTISGYDYLYMDATVDFTVNPDAFTQLVSVADASGEGYTLTCTAGTAPGAPGSIQLQLDVEAGYSQSTPVITPPEGWAVNDGDMSSEHNPEGGVSWYITMTYGDGTADLVPADPMELTVGVSGVVANPAPSGGGSSGGSSSSQPEKPKIRVENQLDEENASSDTRLWPYGTVEEDGVSVTTVTQEELEALLELARQHAQDVEILEGDGYKEGIIVIEDLDENKTNSTYILKLTEDQFQSISQEHWDRFTVQTPAGSLSLYGGSIQQAAALEGEVDVTITRLEHGDRPGVDVTLTVGGVPVTEFGETYGVRIFVPYVPAPEEDVNAIVIEYIHEDGTLEVVTECFYDPVAGGVYFFTNHLSKFGVAYRPSVFSDVGADHWATPYVTFLAARGLLDGTGSRYRPDDAATRGEMISLLSQALSAANLPASAVQVYDDVPASSSLARASGWLYFNNLASALTSGGKLRPDEAITREDMAALLGNIASGVGLRLRSKGLDTGYTDLGQVASYAQTSVVRLRSAGILEMAENYKFNPKATLNRGEMAQIVATLLSSL